MNGFSHVNGSSPGTGFVGENSMICSDELPFFFVKASRERKFQHKIINFNAIPFGFC
jgi:hypothetical protein